MAQSILGQYAGASLPQPAQPLARGMLSGYAAQPSGVVQPPGALMQMAPEEARDPFQDALAQFQSLMSEGAQ